MNNSGLATGELKQILKGQDFDFNAIHINPNAREINCPAVREIVSETYPPTELDPGGFEKIKGTTLYRCNGCKQFRYVNYWYGGKPYCKSCMKDIITDGREDLEPTESDYDSDVE